MTQWEHMIGNLESEKVHVYWQAASVREMDVVTLGPTISRFERELRIGLMWSDDLGAWRLVSSSVLFSTMLIIDHDVL